MNRAAACVIACALSGCSAFTTYPNGVGNRSSVDRGLVYHLPLKYLILTVTTATTKQEDGKMLTTWTPAVDVSDAYPDAASYVLRYNVGMFSKNEVTIGVNEKGLLTNATAKTTNQVSEALSNLASSAGSLRSAGKRASAAPPLAHPCLVDGTYKRLIDLSIADSDTTDLCGIDFTWSMPAHTSANASLANPRTSVAGTDGLFYRQLAVVKITALPKGTPHTDSKDFLVFAPDPWQVSYLPIPKTLFANSNATFSFTDGMPTSYAPTTESEILAVFKLPADVIGAYFEAVGKVFDAFSDNGKSETDAQAAEAALAFQKWKTQQCVAAIGSDDAEAIQAACAP